MDKCPKCGAGEDASEGAFSCGTRRGVNGTVKVSGRCLRRQLAAANEKLADSARLATESAQLADGLARDLAAADERAGRLDAAVRWALGGPGSDFRGRNEGEGQFYWRTDLAKLAGLAWDNEAGDYREVPDAL